MCVHEATVFQGYRAHGCRKMIATGGGGGGGEFLYIATCDVERTNIIMTQ